MKSILLCFGLFLFTIHIYAQTGSISGRVMDINNKPLSYANIILLKAQDSALIKADVTNDGGAYNLTALANGNYIMKVTLLGYEAYANTVLIAGNAIAVPDVKLAVTGTELKEVAVRAQKPFIEVHADKLVVNVENSIVSAGSSAYEVLQRSPGVTTDQNDNISLKGKQGVTIMINGKIQPIAGTDLANILKAMPANTIDKIELISNPSAKYDAAGTAGIINILLKKDQRYGANGSINLGYKQGIYAKTNGGMNINYRNNKLNLYASYNHYYAVGFNHLMLDRTFSTGDAVNFIYEQDHYLKFPVLNEMASIGLDYNLNPKTTLGISANGAVSTFNPRGTVLSNDYNAAHSLDSVVTTRNLANNKTPNYSVNLNMKHVFDSAGRELTVDADYARYDYTNHQEILTSSTSGSPDYLLHGDVTGNTQIRSVKADYSSQIFKDGKLETGIKSSWVTADNNPMFFDASSGVNIFDPTKSDHFIYNEYINAAYLNISKDLGKWSMQLGMRGEHTIAMGDEKTTDTSFTRSYFQFFPSLAVQRHLDKNNDLGLTLSRRIERPNYQQLNPFKYFLDPTLYVVGNPNLNPALTYAVELSHTYRQKFITTLSYSITKDVITEVLIPTDGITVQTDRNLATMNYVGLSVAYPFKFTKWWSNVTNATGFYSQYLGNLANTNLNNGKATYNINSNNSFLLPWGVSAEVGVIYQAAQAYGFMHMEPQWMVNAGLQKTFFNKRATFKANISDLFYSWSDRATTAYTGYLEHFNVRRDTRQAGIAFTYRFGKNTVPPIRRHNGGAEDEKSRAGGQGGA